MSSHKHQIEKIAHKPARGIMARWHQLEVHDRLKIMYVIAMILLIAFSVMVVKDLGLTSAVVSGVAAGAPILLDK